MKPLNSSLLKILAILILIGTLPGCSGGFSKGLRACISRKDMGPYQDQCDMFIKFILEFNSPPDQPVSNGSCPPGCIRGTCTSVPGAGPKPSPTSPNCYKAGVPCGPSSACISLGDSFGSDYLAQSDLISPSIVGEFPPSGSTIYSTDIISIVYNESIDIGSVDVNNTTTGKQRPYFFNKGVVVNDTIMIPAEPAWTGGVLPLNVKVADIGGNTIERSLSYNIVNRDQINVAMAAHLNFLGGAYDGAILLNLNNGWFARSYTASDGWPGYLYHDSNLGRTFGVHGGVYLYYVSLGLHNSWLGYPAGDHYVCGAFGADKCINFQNGYIQSNAVTGTVALPY